MPTTITLGNGTNTAAPLTAGTLETALTDASGTYALNCAVCHGATGGGLAEARLAFPADHRNCTRCHKQNNSVVMPLDRPIKDNDMFPVGDPPALHVIRLAEVTPGGEPEPDQADGAPGPSLMGASGGAPVLESTPLASAAAPEALFGYIRSTMPRYHPGKLSDSEYWLLTAYLLNMNGRTQEAASAAASAARSGWLATPSTAP